MTKMPRVLELFKPTGSIGAAFERIGWEVISVDLVAKFNPTHVANIANFEYKQYAPDYFDFLWGSPPCTQFSVAKTCGKRDIEGATKLVEKTPEIIRYFNCQWAFENPQSGFLKKSLVCKEFLLKMFLIANMACLIASLRESGLIWAATIGLPDQRVSWRSARIKLSSVAMPTQPSSGD